MAKRSPSMTKAFFKAKNIERVTIDAPRIFHREAPTWSDGDFEPGFRVRIHLHHVYMFCVKDPRWDSPIEYWLIRWYYCAKQSTFYFERWNRTKDEEWLKNEPLR